MDRITGSAGRDKLRQFKTHPVNPANPVILSILRMTFSIKTLLYTFALLASCLALIGVWGALVWLVVLGFWACWFGVPGVSINNFVVFCFLPIGLPAFFLPAFQSARESHPANKSENNMKQLVLGIINHDSIRKSLPPAYVADETGVPLHSWRTLLWPFVEQGVAFERLDLAKPWNDPGNPALGCDEYPYQSPRFPSSYTQSMHTNYFAVVGDETAWPPGGGIAFDDITDDTASTIALIEVPRTDIHMMEPRDMTVEEAVQYLTGETSDKWGYTVDSAFTRSVYNRPEKVLIAFMDGHVDSFGVMDRETALALLTRNGGEQVDADDYAEGLSRPRYVREYTPWERVWAAVVFVLLVVLPGFLRKRAS